MLLPGRFQCVLVFLTVGLTVLHYFNVPGVLWANQRSRFELKMRSGCRIRLMFQKCGYLYYHFHTFGMCRSVLPYNAIGTYPAQSEGVRSQAWFLISCIYV